MKFFKAAIWLFVVLHATMSKEIKKSTGQNKLEKTNNDTLEHESESNNKITKEKKKEKLVVNNSIKKLEKLSTIKKNNKIELDNASIVSSPANSSDLEHKNLTISTETSPINIYKENSVQLADIKLGNDPLEYYSDDEQFFYARKIRCAMNNCAPPSFCIDATTCKCGEGYANVFLPSKPKMIYCQYRQKQQLVAFMLETFLSAGIGHFYAGRVTMGMIKLLVCLSPIFLMCCAACFRDKDGGCCVLLSTTLMCSFLIWQVIDIINFATNSYKDGYGIPLNHW
jgi:hypothetical protein